jgi:hypothetical protein
MWNSVERMVEAARDGIFVETAFDEGRLSRLESKMYQYLVSGQTSRRQTEREGIYMERIFDGAEWVWCNDSPRADEYGEFVDSFPYEAGRAVLRISADSICLV